LQCCEREKAKLLGYPNYAAYVLYDQMAQTPEAVQKFITQLVPPTRAKAAEEAKLIQGAIDKDGAHFPIAALGLAALCRKGAQGTLCPG
jgi:peptidyl-dipeptidase Dcp